MPYDPNHPYEDPRQGMSSGGPAPNQPQLPPPTTSGGMLTTNGGITGTGTVTGVGNGPGEIPPGDRTNFFGSIADQFGINPLGNPDGGRNLPPEMQNLVGRMGQGGGDGPMAALGGAAQIPGYLGPPGSSGVGGDVGALQGLDFTQPGALEAYQKQTAGYFQQPTLSEMFAKDQLARGAGPGVSNRADQAFQTFSGSTPANMDPYYENERRKATEAINKTMAARGAYGSSAANDMIGEAYTNLAADAAKANAQYGLQRAGLLGSLAQGADQSSLAGSTDRRNWMGALGSLAGGADAAGLSRVIGGANVASAAQGAQRTRGQDAFNNQLQMGDRMSGIMGEGYNGLFGMDADLFKTAIGLNTGTASEGYSQASNNAMLQRGNVANFNNMLGENMKFGQGLYDMFRGPQSPQSPPPSPMPTSPASSDELPRNPYVYP